MKGLKNWMVIGTFCVLIINTGCNKESYDPYNAAVAKEIKNEAYGTGSRQVADIYLPANRSTSTPVVLLIHGGSWSDGNKTDLDAVLGFIKQQWAEVAIVNINYTLANNTSANYHPAQMNDIKQALDYIDSKRALWKIGNNTAITGVSAGAHLGLLYAYAYDATKRIKAVVTVVGPTDFSDPLYVNSPLFQVVASNLVGKTWLQDPDLHRAVSPALRVTATSPPTFMAYGALDPIVPLSNAYTLRTKLLANSVSHTYVEYPGEAHEFSNTAIADLVPKVVLFLKTNL